MPYVSENNRTLNYFIRQRGVNDLSLFFRFSISFPTKQMAAESTLYYSVFFAFCEVIFLK